MELIGELWNMTKKHKKSTKKPITELRVNINGILREKLVEEATLSKRDLGPQLEVILEERYINIKE